MGKTLGTIAKIAVGVGLVVFAPQVTAALLVASGTTVAAAATVTAITSAIMGIGASLALSTASTALFGPKAPKTQLTRLNVSLDPITPRKAVFGTTAMPLDLRYHEASGTNQEFIDYIIAVAAHKVTAISEIWFEEKQAWTASGGVTATYNGFLTVTTRTEGTSANTIAINGGGKWGSSRRLTGCAYVHLRIKRTGATSKTQSPLVNGLPSRVTIIGNGALLYDPRKDSTVPGGSGTHRAADQTTWGAYTDADDCDNPALQLLWWLLGWKINGKLSIGCGVPANRIDIASFITAANICDENVTLAIGGTQKRYRTSGTASDSDNRMDIINTFLTSMNGTLRDNGGKLTLSLMKNDLASYSLDLSENDMLGEFEWQQTRGLTESYNVVRGRYVDPSVNSLYQPVDYPEVSIASADGIERATTLDLMYVEDGRRAQRIAKQVLQRNQYRGMFSATFNTKALGCQVGDVVRLTVSSLGWTNKLFRVVSQEIRFDGQVPLALVEENAAIYAWSNEDQAPVVPTSPTIYNPLNDPFILGLADTQAIADGKIDSYYQTEPPSGATEGDYWTDTNDSNKLYRYTSGAWVSIQDGGIPAAISAAAGAQATANGKVTTYYSETTPTATAIGDLWYKPSTGFVQRWNGSAWADVATLGATIGENVKDKSGNPVAIEAIRNNLALIDWWKKGATIPWANNAEFNSIVSVPADAATVQPPVAGQPDVWFCEEVTGNSEQGGGWNAAPIAFLDPDKAYRFVLPIRKLAGNGGSYWGINSVADLNTTTANTNPYFAVRTLTSFDRWYLFVGYIFPRNSTGKNSDGAGIWDCKTGTKIQSGTNYCFLPAGTQPTHRAYQYYASLGAQQMFGMPLIEPIESMSDMTLYFEEAARLNNAIGVNGSGQFVNPVGTGNGTTIANSQITVDGSGQLAGIGTGNNTVVANNQINITSGNLNGIGTGSGTTVANNQIAVNVSGQISGIGTGNLTEVGNDRMDITFDTLGTDGRVRAQLRRNGGTTVNTTIQLPSAAQNADQLWSQVSGTGRPQDNATVGARAGTNIFRTDGTTVMTQAEIRTAEGTAAAILNQAATATNSDFSAVTGTTKPENNATVGATAGTNLRRSNATILGDNDIITSLGTAALIAGQGALATKSAVDLATSEVLNKSLANVDATASTKLGGIQAGATVGARAGTNLYRTDGTTVLTQAEVRTAEGTAAAITGQAATATSSDFSVVTGATKPENNATVGATAGTNLRRANATVLNDGDIITSLGTAALIAGQGALATKSAVDLATAEVLNKSLANVDATASTKLGGIQAGATVGARAGTNLYRSDGTTVMTQAEVRTAEGTAASITGQGALATKSAVAWATEVSGRDVFLTDGRISAGLDTSGRNQVGIISAGGVPFTNPEIFGTVNGTNIAANPEFLDGTTAGWSLYDNSGGGKVSMAVVSDTTAPNASGNILRISYNGTGTPGSNPLPGYGGAVQYIFDALGTYGSARSRPGHYSRGTTIIYSIIAKIPVGYNLEFASNAFGAEGSFLWMTSTAGTGGWQRYIGRQIIGTTGSFSSTGYLYVLNGSNAAFSWDIAKYDQVDITSANRTFLGRGGLTRETGVGVFDNDAITSLGTSAAIAGQGALATKSAVDLATSEVINKSLANVDSTASTKLGGIETGATVGATAGTNLRRSNATVLNDGDIITSLGTAALIANQGALATRSNARLGNEVVDEGGNAIAAEFIRNNVNRGNVGTMAYPSGGTFAAEVNGLTGAFQIMLPNTFADGRYTMIKFQVDIYNYSTDTSVTYDISGYVYPLLAAPTWYNMTAKVVGGGVGSVKPVRFGRTGSASTDKFCVWIGDTNSVWYYPKVQVRNVMTGYSSIDVAFWQSGWAVSTVTAFGTVDASVLNPTAGDAVFGVNAREEWNGAVATLPNFKTSQGTAAAIVNQGTGATANTLAQLDATAAAQLSSAVNGAAQSVARSATIEKVLNNNASVSIDAASAIFSSGGGATYTLQLKIREVGGTDVNVGSAASVFIAASESDYLQVSGTYTNTSGGTRRYQITCALTKVGAGTAVETQSQSYLRG